MNRFHKLVLGVILGVVVVFWGVNLAFMATLDPWGSAVDDVEEVDVTAVEARTYIAGKLQCDDDGTEFAMMEVVWDGGVGLVLTQTLLLINQALAEGLVPLLPHHEMLWFSGKYLNIRDLVHLPCRMDPQRIVKRIRVRYKCDGGCSQESAFNSVQVPSMFHHKGLMWWWRQLTLTVIRPSKLLLKRMEKLNGLLRGESGLLIPQHFPKPYISLHVRGGDACSSHRPKCMDSASDILGLLQQNHLVEGTVLLATDKESMLTELTQQAHDRQLERLQFYSLDIDRTFYGKSMFHGGRQSYEDDKHLVERIKTSPIALEAVADLLLLAQGEVHVGSFYSNFIRMAFNLGERNSNFRYISFDASWCPHEVCTSGWFSTKERCRKWLRHLCLWKGTGECSWSPACGNFHGTPCEDSCLFYQRYRTMDPKTWPHDICCSQTCLEQDVPEEQCEKVLSYVTKVFS